MTTLRPRLELLAAVTAMLSMLPAGVRPAHAFPVPMTPAEAKSLATCQTAAAKGAATLNKTVQKPIRHLVPAQRGAVS